MNPLTTRHRREDRNHLDQPATSRRQHEPPRVAPPPRDHLGRDWTQPPPISTYLTEHDGGLILLDSGEPSSAAKGWFPWWNPYFQFAVDIHVEPGDEIGPGCGRRG
jgi:hypothetical protein